MVTEKLQKLLGTSLSESEIDENLSHPDPEIRLSTIIYLGYSNENEDIFISCLDDGDPDVRIAAIRSLRQTKNKKAIKKLIYLLSDDAEPKRNTDDYRVCWEAALILKEVNYTTKKGFKGSIPEKFSSFIFE